jgi:hypothetical protein
MNKLPVMAMYGIYLKCDSCGATLGGEIFDPPLTRWEDKKLQAKARELGWTGPLTRESDKDRCPSCSLPFVIRTTGGAEAFDNSETDYNYRGRP